MCMCVYVLMLKSQCVSKPKYVCVDLVTVHLSEVEKVKEYVREK